MLQVVLVGGGHAMLPVLRYAQRWREDDIAHVTLYDAQPSLYYSGMIPEYLGGVYEAQQARIDLAPLCRRFGVSFRHVPVVDINPDEGIVTDASGDTARFDTLALDIGGRNPALPEDALPTKPLHRLPDVNTRIQNVLHEPGVRFSLCVVGGGAAGVEILLNVTARFQAAGRHRALDATLVEASEALLPGFPGGMQEYVRSVLTDRGVEIHTGRRVSTVAPHGVEMETGDSIAAETVLWATGVQGPPLLRDSGFPLDDRAFVRVDDTLQVEGQPRIFAAGDCATITGRESLQKVGVHAVKQGPDLATNLDRTVRRLRRTGTLPDPATLRAFQPYRIAPLILSTGTSEGIWTAGDAWWHGTAALRLKHLVDRRWIQQYNAAYPPFGSSLFRAEAAL